MKPATQRDLQLHETILADFRLPEIIFVPIRFPPIALTTKYLKVGFSKLQVRIFRSRLDVIDRAKGTCPGGGPPLCWGAGMTEAQAQQTLRIAHAAVAKCFGADKIYGLIGFSNGGYMATKIYRSCMERPDGKKIPWFIGIGSEAVTEPVSKWANDLTRCGNLTIIEGIEDQENFDSSGKFISDVLLRNGAARAVQFKGGHLVPFEPTRQLIQESLLP